MLTIDGQLPELSHPLLSGAEFDIALMSAVWMHIPPEERAPSLARLYELLSDEGAAFITLRIGPSDKTEACILLMQQSSSNPHKWLVSLLIPKANLQIFLGGQMCGG